MKSQRFKDFYGLVSAPATYASYVYWKYRLQSSVPRQLRRGEYEQLWLNLGSGANPFPRFVNIDINISRAPDMWLDARRGLPFPNESVDAIYPCHVLEHFYWDELVGVLKECQRVLRRGGGIRMLVPSLDMAIDAYNQRKRDWFTEFPTAFDSLGGRFTNFLFCDGQHRLAFDYSFASEVLRRAGFQTVIQMEQQQSDIFPPEQSKGMEPFGGTADISLIVEAKKAE